MPLLMIFGFIALDWLVTFCFFVGRHTYHLLLEVLYINDNIGSSGERGYI